MVEVKRSLKLPTTHINVRCLGGNKAMHEVVYYIDNESATKERGNEKFPNQ